MSYFDLEEKLKEIKIENYIWVIYIGIIIFSFYSNSLEKRYYIYNDQIAKKKYRETLLVIFSILTIVYYYFFKSSFDDYNNLKETDSKNKKELVTLSFISSFLIFISGLIFLYVAYKDQNIDVEIAFN